MPRREESTESPWINRFDLFAQHSQRPPTQSLEHLSRHPFVLGISARVASRLWSEGTGDDLAGRFKPAQHLAGGCDRKTDGRCCLLGREGTMSAGEPPNEITEGIVR
jgi:hypothetical protein